MFSSRSLCELTATELRDTAVHRQRETIPAGSSTHAQHHHFQNHSKIGDTKIGGKSINLGGYKFGGAYNWLRPSARNSAAHTNMLSSNARPYRIVII